MTENKVEILPLVAEDHELITTKLDKFKNMIKFEKHKNFSRIVRLKIK